MNFDTNWPAEDFGIGGRAEAMEWTFAQDWTPLPLPDAILGLAGARGAFDRNGPLWTRTLFTPDARGLEFPSEYVVERDPLVIPEPRTLDEFVATWEAFRDSSFVVARVGASERAGRIFVNVATDLDDVPSDSSRPDSQPPFVFALELPTPASELPTRIDGLEFVLEPMDSSETSFWTDYTEHEYGVLEYHLVGRQRGRRGGVSIPVTDTESEAIDGHRIFVDGYGLDWRDLPFVTLFPELTRVTQELTDLTFPELEELIEGERASAEDEIDLFGATIPASAATR